MLCLAAINVKTVVVIVVTL